MVGDDGGMIPREDKEGGAEGGTEELSFYRDTTLNYSERQVYLLRW